MVNSEGIRPENYSKGRVSPELIKYMLRNSKCPWCGLFCFRDYNREHIVPRSLGGSNRFNIMRAHPTCNKIEGAILRYLWYLMDGKSFISISQMICYCILYAQYIIISIV